ncbi:hypothetical protein L7F22_066446 [Adiantum nelumboides]|nr:hypothetical protein [Adiantum nelumboides]
MLAGPHARRRRAALQAVRHFSNLASLSYSTTKSYGHNVSSTTIVQSLCSKGNIEEALEYLLYTLTNPPLDAYLALLKACIARQSLPITLFVYTHLTLHVSDFSYVLGDYLVVALAKCSAIDDAFRTSCALPHRTVFSWTAIISACVDDGRAQAALKMHVMMKEDGVEPNEFTYASLLKACGILRDLQTGRQLHEDARKKGFTSFYFVGNTLVSMYGKCGAIADAVDAFVSLPQHGGVAWNAMLRVYVEQDQGEEALQLYRMMQELHVDPDQLSLLSALQACGILAEKGGDSAGEAQSTRAICKETVQALHSIARKRGFLSNIYVGTTLLCVYGKVGTIHETENVFISMPVCNIVSWNAMVLAYIEQGKGERALQFYRLMLEERMDPDHHTFATALKACYRLADEEESAYIEGTCLKGVCLEIGNAIYNDAQKKGMASDPFIATALLSVFGRCGATFEAERLLSSLTHPNVVSWTAMVSAYLAGGQAAKALQSYGYMIREGVKPDQQAFVLAIQACNALSEKELVMAADCQWRRTVSLKIGQGLHADALKMGLAFGVFVGSSLVTMYGKVGDVSEAERAFSTLPQNSVVAWTAMLSAYVEQGLEVKALQLFRHMHEQGVGPDEQALLTALQACGSFVENEQEFCSINSLALVIVQALHEDIWKLGYASDPFITSNLVIVYGKCGSIKDAENVFSKSLQQNVVSWSAMASCFIQQGDGERALQLYRDMQREQMTPDSFMSAIAIQACRMLRSNVTEEESSIRSIALEIVQAVHADARRKSFAASTEVGKALVIFYSEFGTMEEAENTFSALPINDPVCWNAMLSAYVCQGQGRKALQLYAHMQEEGLDPDSASFVLALQACGMLGKNEETYLQDIPNTTVSAQIIQALHADAHRKGFTSDVFTGNISLDVYGGCGKITEAENMVGTLPRCGISFWNAMLSAYIKQGLVERALQLFRRMQVELVTLNEITVICALQACSETGNLTLCQQLHVAAVAAGHDLNLSLMTTLIHAYGRCACTVDGQAVFKGLPLPPLASWTACIVGHAGKGYSIDSLRLFEELHHAGVKLDGTIFTSAFAACSHAGLVVEGIEFFASISRDYNIQLDARHYGSMVDLLGRAGDFKRLEDLLWRMPMPADSSLWASLLGACRVHGNLELGKQAFCHALQFQPKEGYMYVIMSNIFADKLHDTSSSIAGIDRDVSSDDDEDDSEASLSVMEDDDGDFVEEEA